MAQDRMLAVPAWIQLLVLIFLVITGPFIQVAQALLYGVDEGLNLHFAAFAFSELALFCFSAALLFVLSRRSDGLLHPLLFYFVLFAAYREGPHILNDVREIMSLRGAGPATAPDLAALRHQPQSLVFQSVTLINLATLLANACVVAGFYAMKPERPIWPSISTDWMPSPKAATTVLIGAAVGSLLFLVAILEVRGGLGNHMQSLTEGRFIALGGWGPAIVAFKFGIVALVVLAAMRPDLVAKWWFFGLALALSLGQYLLTGGRGAAMTMVVIVLLAMIARLQRVPWRMLIVAVPLAVMAFGAMTHVRYAPLQQSSVEKQSPGADAAAGAAVEAVIRPDELLETISDNTARIDELGGAAPLFADGIVPRTGLMWGQTYGAFLTFFVPRALWSDKPRSPGAMFAQEYHNAPVDGQGIPIGSVGEAYWNFHVPGVIVVHLLFGMLMVLVYRTYKSNPDNALVIARYVLFLTFMSPATENLVRSVQIFGCLAVVFGALWALGWLLQTKARAFDPWPRS